VRPSPSPLGVRSGRKAAAMSREQHRQAMTLLRTHRKRMEALAPAGLHSVIVAAPEPPPPTFASIEDPDAGDGDFIPLPPHLWHEPRPETVKLNEVASLKRELIYLGEEAAMKAYRRVARELARIFEIYFDLICPGESGTDVGGARYAILLEDMHLIYLLNSVGAISKSHTWTLAVHHFLERADPGVLTGHFAWWTAPTRDQFPNEPEQEFSRFAEFAKALPPEDPRLNMIISAHILTNDLVTSSLVAIDGMIEVLEEAPGRPANLETASSAKPGRPPLHDALQLPAFTAPEALVANHLEQSENTQDHPEGIVETTPRPGYLGLIIHPGRMTVGRVGLEAVVSLAGKKLKWGLLLRLIDTRDSYCSMDMLRGVWSDYGRSDDPDIGTVHDALSELKKLLQPLGLAIVNAPSLGWRLAARPSKPGAAS
jgi:hypothetical protein